MPPGVMGRRSRLRTGGGATADAIEAAYATAVGETLEVGVARDTCPAVTFGFDGSAPNAAVTTVLDRLLGPPT